MNRRQRLRAVQVLELTSRLTSATHHQHSENSLEETSESEAITFPALCQRDRAIQNGHSNNLTAPAAGTAGQVSQGQKEGDPEELSCPHPL